jgi:Ceramidase
MVDFLDAYCERTGPGLWDEPLNAVTNLAFIMAGSLALRLWRTRPGLNVRNGWDLLLLIALLFAIGIGSTLWHTFATRWAEAADTIPILLFINVFLLAFLVRLAGLRWLGTLFFFALFQFVNRWVASAFPRDLLNGSIFYGPTWATLLVMTIVLAARKHPAARDFALATGVFTVSLIFRTIDEAICPAVPTGTHFLWHVCNAIVLYLLLAALIRQGWPLVRATEPA